MKSGIKLDFDSATGMATIVEPKERVPLCLGNNKCKYLKIKPDDSHFNGQHNDWYCNRIKRPVFDILGGEGRCPLSYWYSWKEGAVTEIIIGPEVQRENLKNIKKGKK